MISKILEKAKPHNLFRRHRREEDVTDEKFSLKKKFNKNHNNHANKQRENIQTITYDSPPLSPIDFSRTLTTLSRDTAKSNSPVLQGQAIPHQQETASPPLSTKLATNEDLVEQEDDKNIERLVSKEIYTQEVCRKTYHLSLNNFFINRTLGTGSFGRVHLIQSKVNGRYYALKVLSKAEIVKLKQVEHTNNERAILSSVYHPFIVNLWGSFQDDAHLYMVMDYVPGGELFSYLRKMKRLSNNAARFYAGEILLALSYLHSKDIIYRDLKPENLLIDGQGHIKMTDFGFAKHVPDITWTLCGTPDYLAPEIIQTKGYGKAADWWAFGVLIYEMLAGYPPYYDDSQFKLYEKILTTKPEYPHIIDSDAKDLLMHLLTSDLSRRYGNLKRGPLDISEHRWFAPVNFQLLQERKIKPPYVPRLRGSGDTSCFDKYPEALVTYGVSQDDPYKDQFPDF
ncbi:camp-dependent protein kinase type 2 [Pilobolus umbonatus]|nr:camp-dependent protein kinase type 2 [Pilobolus umbonatus]